jgi:LDH2 family malate/lactate/ureidoglycolate dehydrogenase
LIDLATRNVAGCKFFAAATLGKSIPSVWLLDAEANPTRDATLFSHAASLTALGGYKGFCIAFMIEVLAAVLTGSSISREVLSWTFSDASVPTGHGAAFMAINIESFLPLANFKNRMDHLIAEIHSVPKAGDATLYAPGEIEFRNREKALSAGIDLPEDVVMSLRALASESDLKFPPE